MADNGRHQADRYHGGFTAQRQRAWDIREAIRNEMADRTRVIVATGIEIYFCGQQGSWLRGQMARTRHKRTPETGIPQEGGLSTYWRVKLNALARRRNERPRKTRDFDTPTERFPPFVASPN